MENHCMEIVDDSKMFVFNINKYVEYNQKNYEDRLKTFIYDFESADWNEIDSNSFPCQPNPKQQIHCKAYKDDFIVIPSVKNGTACTALFDMKTQKWARLENDLRNAPYKGKMEKIFYSGKETILFMGGQSYENDVIDNKIWTFHGSYYGWIEMSLTLPDDITKNSTLYRVVFNWRYKDQENKSSIFFWKIYPDYIGHEIKNLGICQSFPRKILNF